MKMAGVPAVAGDTGGGGSNPLGPSSETAEKAHSAPRTKRSAADGKSASESKAKRGRLRLAMTDLMPAKPAAWYSGRGPTGPCVFCVAKVMARVERPTGARLRVLHAEDCKRAV